jgi:6,7-dimethyl-8-ribityllumazine synthase
MASRKKQAISSQSLPSVPSVIEGELVVPAGARFAVVASRFNEFIVARLIDGAMDALRRHGADMEHVSLVRCPGSWEMPLVASKVARSGKVDAVVAVGCVIRGGTPHFDYVASEVTKGIAHVSLYSGVPITLGVLTTDTIEQAVERAGTKAGNKGWDAAMSAIEMVSLARKLG